MTISLLVFLGVSSLSVNSSIHVETTVSDSTISVNNEVEAILIPLEEVKISSQNVESINSPIKVEYEVIHYRTGKTVEKSSQYYLGSNGELTATETLNITEFDSNAYPVNTVTTLGIDVKASHPDLGTGVETKEIQIARGVDNRNCNTIKNSDPTANSGVYSIQPEGVSSEFDVYCDMDYDGGGWTLVMKSSGSDNSFRYNSKYWTSDSNTLNSESVNLDTTVPTKLKSYNTVNGDEIRAEFPDHQDHQMVEEFVSERTPYSIFTTTDERGYENDGSGTPTCGTNAGIGRFGDYWYNFDGETNENNADTIFAHQCGRQQYGFNISTGYDAFTSTKIRWGWNWQNEDYAWESQDAVAGIGLVKDATGGDRSSDGVYSTTVGSQVYCCSNKDGDRDNGDGEYPRDVLIWVR